ncbi:MAG: hypothetical protein E7675_07505 [Ruminococcaceae bacterium]|nr:hypothetical protein [Oscillospiraceae bacterium]
MKVIFLDIDGVMNSKSYDLERKSDKGIMDPTRVELLKKIIDKTGAEIVLTSSWRRGWSRYENACFGGGKILWQEFSRAYIEVYDKTDELGDRTKEVKAWLEDNPETEEFVILDDIHFGWEDLDDRVVKTSYYTGRGLEEHHVNEAVKILNGER